MKKLRSGAVAPLLLTLAISLPAVWLPSSALADDSGTSLREKRMELSGVSRILELRQGRRSAAAMELPTQDLYNVVPPDHWAYPALRHLSDEGLIDGYPDGFFKGDRPLTRYEFAQAMSNLLPMQAAGNESQLAAAALRTEFADQLLGLESELDELSRQLEDLQQRLGRVSNANDEHSDELDG